MSRYITRSDIEEQVGADNCTYWADLDGTQDAVKIEARITKAIAYAEDFIDDRFRATQYAVPLTAQGGTLNALFCEVARFAAYWLYTSRGTLDNDNVTQKMTRMRDDALAEFNRYLDGSARLAAARNPGSGGGAPKVAGGPKFANSVARAEGVAMDIPGGPNCEPWPGSWRNW